MIDYPQMCGLQPWLLSLSRSTLTASCLLTIQLNRPENVLTSSTPQWQSLSSRPLASAAAPGSAPSTHPRDPYRHSCWPPPIACKVASRAPGLVQACSASGSLCQRGCILDTLRIHQPRGQQRSILCFCLFKGRDGFQGLSVMIRVWGALWGRGFRLKGIHWRLKCVSLDVQLGISLPGQKPLPISGETGLCLLWGAVSSRWCKPLRNHSAV